MSDTTKPAFRFSKVRRRIYFELETLEGKIENYFLQELLASEADAWLDYSDERQRASSENVNGQNASFKASLISRCLFSVEKQTLVPIEEILNYPSVVQQALWLECQKMNGFLQVGIDEAKKPVK